MLTFIRKIPVLLGTVFFVGVLSLTVSAEELVCYDFDNYEGTLNTVGLQRNAENAEVRILREDGNVFGHMYVPNASEGKTPYVVLRQVLNDKSFSIEAGKAYIFSMDIKSDTAAPGNMFYLFNWQYTGSWTTGFIAFSCSEGEKGSININFIDQNSGQIVGTHPVEENKFFNVSSVLDGTTKSFVYYCNGERINTEPVVMTDSEISYIDRFGFRYHCNLNSGDANIYYDNVRVEKIDSFGVEKTSLPESGKADCEIESMSVVFNEEVDAETVEKIKIFDENGKEIRLRSELSKDGKTVKLTLDEALRANSAYKISTVGVKHRIAEMTAEEEISFETSDGLNITKPVLYNSNGDRLETLATDQVSAEIYVDNERYQGNISGVTLIIAYYKNKKLIKAESASLETITADSQKISVSMDIEESSGQYYVKLFVIDNHDEMLPLRYGVKILGS